jgi:hypothetical protein
MGKMKALMMQDIEGNEEFMDGFVAFQFEQALEHIFNDGFTLLVKKHEDYGPKNISQSPGGPLNGLRVRMWDKLARINHLVDNGASPSNESLRDSFMDLMNYSAIAMMVLDGDWPQT